MRENSNELEELMREKKKQLDDIESEIKNKLDKSTNSKKMMANDLIQLKNYTIDNVNRQKNNDEEEFEGYAKKFKIKKPNLRNDQQSEIYGLYKQAREGDNIAEKPGILSGPTTRRKWVAWEA